MTLAILEGVSWCWFICLGMDTTATEIGVFSLVQKRLVRGLHVRAFSATCEVLESIFKLQSAGAGPHVLARI